MSRASLLVAAEERSNAPDPHIVSALEALVQDSKMVLAFSRLERTSRA
jgi:hypothetical protein